MLVHVGHHASHAPAAFLAVHRDGTVHRTGNVVDAILGCVAAHRGDLIAMATHGRSALGTLQPDAGDVLYLALEDGERLPDGTVLHLRQNGALTLWRNNSRLRTRGPAHLAIHSSGDPRVGLLRLSEGAARIAAQSQWGTQNAPEDRVTVGRLGTYEPGIEGARMAPLAIIGTWQVD